MGYLSKKEIALRKKYIKQIIEKKGFWFYYYSLNKEQVITNGNYSIIKKEESKLSPYYKFLIKGILLKEENAEYSIKPMGDNSTGLLVEQKLNAAEIYGYTPIVGTDDEWRKYNEIMEQYAEFNEFILPLMPQKGDYIKFPIESPADIESFNQIHIPTFYEIVDVRPNSFFHLYKYKLILLLKPYIREDQFALNVEDLTNIKDVNRYIANRMRGQLDVGYGELRTGYAEEVKQLEQQNNKKYSTESIFDKYNLLKQNQEKE